MLTELFLLNFKHFSFWQTIFGGRVGFWAMSKVESSSRARLTFPPLSSCSDTLLVVSILDKFMIAICGRFCSLEGVKEVPEFLQPTYVIILVRRHQNFVYTLPKEHF